MVGMHPQSLADFTGKGQAALFREVFTASFKSYLAKLSTVTFIALMDTDEGESENVTPAKSCHRVIILRSHRLTPFDSFGLRLELQNVTVPLSLQGKAWPQTKFCLFFC